MISKTELGDSIKFQLIVIFGIFNVIIAVLLYYSWILSLIFLIIVGAIIITKETASNKKVFMEDNYLRVNYSTPPTYLPHLLRFFFKRNRQFHVSGETVYPCQKLIIRLYKVGKFLIDSPDMDTKNIAIEKRALNNPFVINYLCYLIFEPLIHGWISCCFPFNFWNYRLEGSQLSVYEEIDSLDTFDFVLEVDTTTSKGGNVNLIGKLIKKDLKKESERTMQPVQQQREKEKEKPTIEIRFMLNFDSKAFHPLENFEKPLIHSEFKMTEEITFIKPNVVGNCLETIFLKLNQQISKWIFIKKKKYSIFPVESLLNLKYDSLLKLKDMNTFRNLLKKTSKGKRYKLDCQFGRSYINENEEVNLLISIPNDDNQLHINMNQDLSLKLYS